MSTLLIVLLAIVGAFAVVVALFIIRRRNLSRYASSFDCSLYVGDGYIPGRRPRWRLGIAVYASATLDWYPVFSLGRRAAVILGRRNLEIASRRSPDEDEQYSILPGALILDCRIADQDVVRLAMDFDSLAGFSSWLESAPPGDNAMMGRFT